MKKLFIISDSYNTIIEARETKAQATKRAKEMDDPAKGVFYTAHPANLCGIAVFGKCHQDRNGNTYNTSFTTLFFDNGKTARINTPMAYGYGEQYTQEAQNAMKKAGFLPADYNSALWSIRDLYQIGYTAQAVYVAREKDL